jgi:hypothetical protein
MGFLSKLNKSLGFSKGTKERARALKRREALGLTPKYVEDPMGRILSPRGRFNQSALERRIAEMTALNPGMGSIINDPFSAPFKGEINEAALQARAPRMPGMPRRGGPRRGDMGMPRMNFGDQIGYTMPSKGPGMPIDFDDPSFRMIGTPQPIPEQMPTDPSSYYNPTIFGQQIGDMDFSQMPEISPVDMSNLQMPTLPQEISQMNIPQMPEGLPSMQDVQKIAPRIPLNMQPRAMMAGGDEVSPEQEIFSLQAQLKNLEEQLRLDRSYNDDQAVINTSAEMAAIQKRIQEIMNGMPELAGGGDFPDLTGDGKVTQADILKGRGVYAEGDEVMMMQETDMMAPGNQEIEASLMEVQGMQPDMQVLDQYVQMVTQMIQAGASEAEVIESLRQAGLDDDDIAAVFQAVMETMQGSMEQGGIDSELAQLG